jgi:hypothetical protein
VPIERFVRDIDVASHHIALTWDEAAVAYARVRWGLPPQPLFI